MVMSPEVEGCGWEPVLDFFPSQVPSHSNLRRSTPRKNNVFQTRYSLFSLGLIDFNTLCS